MSGPLTRRDLHGLVAYLQTCAPEDAARIVAAIAGPLVIHHGADSFVLAGVITIPYVADPPPERRRVRERRWA